MKKKKEEIVSSVPPVQKRLVTPTKVALNMHMSHLGIVFSNLSVVCMVLCASSVLGALLTGIGYMLAVMAMFITVGLIFLWIPNYWDIISNNAWLDNVLGFVSAALPYLVGIGFVASIAAVVLLACDKYESHRGRIIFSAVVLVGSIVALIALLCGGLK